MSTRKHVIQTLAKSPLFEKGLQKVILILLIALYIIPLLLAMLIAWILQGEVIFLRNLAAVVVAYLLAQVVLLVAKVSKNLSLQLFVLRLTPIGLVGALAMPLSLPLAFLLAGIPGIVGALATLIPSMVMSKVMSWTSQKTEHKGQDRKISSSLRSSRSTFTTPSSSPPSPEDIKRANRLTSQGVEAVKVRSYNEALHYFDESLKLNPFDAVTLNNKGYTLDNLHRPDEALAYVEMAIEANPRFEMAWRNKFAMTLKMEGAGAITRIIKDACKALGISEKELLAKWEHGQEIEDQ